MVSGAAGRRYWITQGLTQITRFVLYLLLLFVLPLPRLTFHALFMLLELEDADQKNVLLRYRQETIP